MALTYTADDFKVSEWIDAGHVDIEAHLDPPSLQAVSATKNAYRAALSSAVARGTSRVFTHDVELTLTWYISEKRRYETHVVSDLDNVLKPTIDALVGPDGVLFDDNQVQSIKACWMTGRTPDHRGYQLRVEALMPDDFIPRGGRFVEITPTRCFFVPTMPHKFEVRYVDNLVSTFARYAEWAADGAPDDMLRQLEPTSRSFPRARLSRFEVLKPEQFR